jgi:hypothetical protein
MNHQKIYDKIIKKANLENREKGYGIYYEKHHIIPKSMGGSNENINLVLLTAKEHYIVHRLLTRIYPDNRSILTAFHFMVHGQQGQRMYLSSRVYAEARELFIKVQKTRKLSEETKRKISESRKGKKLSEETKEKIRQKALGRKASEETRKILSNSHKGIEPGNKGKKMGPRSDEVKKQISYKLKGRKKPPRTKEHTRKIIENRKRNKEKEEILKEFINKLVNNQQDIPEDIVEIVNKNFRDLIY